MPDNGRVNSLCLDCHQPIPLELDLPSIKAGKLRRIRRSDLAKWNGTG